ncbi:MAG: SpoIIE family protein phosphatase [Candidatus Riflebacteria bacterium]|nr:SpoIIE family protein phosphatase [Candidatus Riflebacteria bacterium]
MNLRIIINLMFWLIVFLFIREINHIDFQIAANEILVNKQSTIFAQLSNFERQSKITSIENLRKLHPKLTFTQTLPSKMSEEDRNYFTSFGEGVLPYIAAPGRSFVSAVNTPHGKFFLEFPDNELVKHRKILKSRNVRLFIFFVLVSFVSSIKLKNALNVTWGEVLNLSLRALPIMVIFGGLIFFHTNYFSENTFEVKTDVENEIAKYRNGANLLLKIPYILRARLKMFINALYPTDFARDNLNKNLNELKMDLSVQLSLAFFNQSGDIDKNLSNWNIDAEKGKLFFKTLKRLKKGNFRNINRMNLFLEPWMKNFYTADSFIKYFLADSSAMLFNNGVVENNEFLFISAFEDNKIALMHCKVSQKWLSSIAQIILKICRYEMPNCYWAVMEKGSEKSQTMQSWPSIIVNDKRFREYLHDEKQISCFIGNFAVTRGHSLNGIQCFSANFTPKLSLLILNRKQLLLIAAVCFFLITRYLPFNPISSQQLALSSGGKILLILFVITTFLLICMFINFKDQLEEKKKFLEKEVFDEQNRMLEIIDQGFISKLGLLERALEKEFENVKGKNLSELESSAKKVLTDFHSKYATSEVGIFGENGKSIFFLGYAKDNIFENVLKLIGDTIKRAIADFNGESVTDNTEVKEHLLNVTAEMYGFDSEFIFAMLSQHLGKLKVFQSFKSKNIGVLRALKQDDGRIKYLAFLAWRPLVLENEYLENIYSSFSKKGYGISVTLERKPMLINIPALKLNTEFLGIIRKPCRETSLNQSFYLPGIGNYYISKIPMKNLTFDDVVLISNDKKIKDEIKNIWVQFGFSVSGVLIVAFVLWLITIRAFIKPLDDLGNGVRAIEERNFVFRIGKLGKDEFGELAQAFDVMLESFQDLEIARALQEIIFPEKPLELNSWVIAGMCKPSTTVGGDYFDYFKIDERRIIFIIGDVTGHGIPAALVVGMAKAILFHPSNSSFQPDVILANLCYVINSVLRKNKMMTCQIGLFDTVARKLILSNAGHCFPLVVGRNYVREIEIFGLLLGSRLRNKYETRELILSEDEWMFFYSDGLAEANDKRGNILGYKKIHEVLPGQSSFSSADVITNLWKWHNATTSDEPQTDDITFMVLKKNI